MSMLSLLDIGVVRKCTTNYALLFDYWNQADILLAKYTFFMVLMLGSQVEDIVIVLHLFAWLAHIGPNELGFVLWEWVTFVLH